MIAKTYWNIDLSVSILINSIHAIATSWGYQYWNRAIQIQPDFEIIVTFLVLDVNMELVM